MPGSRGFWTLVIVLLVINYASYALFASGKAPSVTIPFSPDFLSQVEKNNVVAINTQGESVSGEFKAAIHYPDSKAEAAKNFETELPTFTNGDQLQRRCWTTTSRSQPSRSTRATASWSA